MLDDGPSGGQRAQRPRIEDDRARRRLLGRVDHVAQLPQERHRRRVGARRPDERPGAVLHTHTPVVEDAPPPGPRPDAVVPGPLACEHRRPLAAGEEHLESRLRLRDRRLEALPLLPPARDVAQLREPDRGAAGPELGEDPADGRLEQVERLGVEEGAEELSARVDLLERRQPCLDEPVFAEAHGVAELEVVRHRDRDLDESSRSGRQRHLRLGAVGTVERRELGEHGVLGVHALDLPRDRAVAPIEERAVRQRLVELGRVAQIGAAEAVARDAVAGVARERALELRGRSRGSQVAEVHVVVAMDGDLDALRREPGEERAVLIDDAAGGCEGGQDSVPAHGVDAAHDPVACLARRHAVPGADGPQPRGEVGQVAAPRRDAHDELIPLRGRAARCRSRPVVAMTEGRRTSRSRRSAATGGRAGGRAAASRASRDRSGRGTRPPAASGR